MKKHEPKSDKEIISEYERIKALPNKGAGLTHYGYYKEGVRQTESELLPLLQASEERVKAEFDIAHEKIEQWAKLKIENDELKQRHEAMIAELKKMMNPLSKNPFYYQEEIQSIITKYEKV